MPNDYPGQGGTRFPIELFDDIELGAETGGLVKGLLDEGGISMSFGETGSAKSFLAISLAVSVAMGWTWFGRRTCRRGGIYLASEGGERIRRRFVACKQHFAEPYRIALDNFGPTPLGVITTAVDLCHPDADLGDLALAINAMAHHFSAPLGLLVIDTVSAALAGGDENKPDVMGTFLGNIRRLQASTAHPETGPPHGHLVHHVGKDRSKGDRGHYSVRAAMDTRWETIKPATEMVGLFRILKQRDGIAGAEFGFRLEVVDLGEDGEGDGRITSCVIVPTGVPEDLAEPKEKKLPPEYRRALEFLWDVVAEVGKPLGKSGYPNVKAVTIEQWRDRLKLRGMYDGDGPNRNWFDRVKKRLVADRLITFDGSVVWPVPSR
jgi:hypothetical protein